MIIANSQQKVDSTHVSYLWTTKSRRWANKRRHLFCLSLVGPPPDSLPSSFEFASFPILSRLLTLLTNNFSLFPCFWTFNFAYFLLSTFLTLTRDHHSHRLRPDLTNLIRFSIRRPASKEAWPAAHYWQSSSFLKTYPCISLWSGELLYGSQVN